VDDKERLSVDRVAIQTSRSCPLRIPEQGYGLLQCNMRHSEESEESTAGPHGQAALSGSYLKAPGSAGGYLLELNGRDLRKEPIEQRKSELARLLEGGRPGLVFNAIFEEPGPIVFEYACKLGCEGIVSKRRGSQYAAGRTKHWLKVKNRAAPAVRREAEEDWGR
jgi:hypothetical protein